MDSEENGNGWRKWTNHVLFIIVMALCTAFLAFYIRSDAQIRELQTKSILEKIDGVEKTMIKNDAVQASKLDKVSEKTDMLCAKVAEHDTLLHLPWVQRDKYYKSFKFEDRK